MNDATKLGDIVNDLYPQCDHKKTEMRYKMCSNGTKHLCIQCLICGARTTGTNWLPQEGVDMSSVKPLDESLEREYTKKTASERNAKLKEEKRLRHLEYERYIRESPDWWSIRERVMRRDNHWCQACFEKTATEVHHTTYANLYQEILWELKAVCSECHRKIHGYI